MTSSAQHTITATFQKMIMRFALILCACFAISACSSSSRTDVETHSTDTSADFEELKTYRWDFSGMDKTVPTGGHTQEFNRVVCEYVDMLMNDRGFTRVAKGDADITLDYRVVVTQEETEENDAPAFDNSEANDYGLRWTFDKDKSPTFQGLQAPKTHAVLYNRGELHLAAFNTQGQTVWHSSAARILKGSSNEAERRAALRIAVEKIMRTFPVAPAIE
ncbi:MAG: DUF4136 domain-containing protein [Cellvibrionales bacterium]|jgi:hypothetical protein|nr:DUF4136 domain-containing protein [Cellvibrionales bacterium]MBK8676040.1 DUF4136 domain-containing protein [Cellvibrionales bacterium]HRF87317.1 DUF4136 domain-containing protein [Pseudomonadales bacterium]HRG50476.1 DUF4136 domain-containing protein [Pseudomonadales bacterium]